MSENNYIQETENVQSILPQPKNILEWEVVKRQMTYLEFVTIFEKNERIKHFNKDTEHDHAVYQATGRGGCKEKAGQILETGPAHMKHAHKNLKKFILKTYNIELIGQKPNFIAVCHLCDHNSTIRETHNDKHTCIEPDHIYYGTATENMMDKTPEVRAAGGTKGGKLGGKKAMESQMAAGTHNSQVRKQCPHCSFETKEFNLNGTHIPACHFNPKSHNYLKPLKNGQTIQRYQKQGLGHKLIDLELMINQNYNQNHI